VVIGGLKATKAQVSVQEIFEDRVWQLAILSPKQRLQMNQDARDPVGKKSRSSSWEKRHDDVSLF
jgi:hypothetical protein